MTGARWFDRVLIALPFGWLIVFALLPVLMALKISGAGMQVGAPPYTPLIGADGSIDATVDNYRFIFSDPLYWTSYLESIRIAGLSTLIALFIGFPMAYGATRAPGRWRVVLLLAIMLPFWTSFLIRVYAWIVVLRPGGVLNSILQGAGLIETPLRVLNTEGAVYLGMVSCYLPFMVLPLFARLERLDPALLEAAADLGARPIAIFWRIVVPLAWPGVVAGCLLMFIPAVGEFVIPEMMGGADTLMIGRVMWSEFFTNRDWPVSAAISVVLLLVLVVPIAILQTLGARTQRST